MQASSPRATLRAVARASTTALVALPALSIAPSIAFAQSTLDPVIVIGTREAQPLSKSVADVVLIDADTLRNSGAGSVADVLRRYAGVQLASNGGPGQTTGYVLRGANTSSTVVMSLLAFFIWGTGPLKDFALALIIGVVLGTYSSVYVAVPFTR